MLICATSPAAYRDLAHRHPRLFHLHFRFHATGPADHASSEVVYRALRSAGLEDAEAAGLGLAFYAFILGYALAEAEGLLRPIGDEDAAELRALDPLAYPATLALIPAFKALDRDAAFDASVNAFIDGVSCRCKADTPLADHQVDAESNQHNRQDYRKDHRLAPLPALYAAAATSPLSAASNIFRLPSLVSGTGLPPAVGSTSDISTIVSTLAAVDLQPAEIVRNAGLLAEIEHGSEKAVEAAVDAEKAGETLDLRLDGRAVEDQHIGHEHAVGHAVMGVVERADRMRQRVDGAEALLEGGRAHRRRAHHVGAGFEIVAVRHRLRQVLEHEPHALDGNALGHRMIARRAIGLEAMGEARPCRCRR